MEIMVTTLADWTAAAEQLLNFAGPRLTWAFSGDVGAGKTTCIQAICRQLGVTDQVTSPTFALVNEYAYLTPDQSSEKLIYHLDLYRLTDAEEAFDMGIEEYLYSGNYCFIEWPELIAGLLPQDSLQIKIEVQANASRKLLIL